MEEDDFYLKWEKHHNAFVSVFDSLYKHNILVDCTLAAEDKFVKAHRIVLMACSPYLEELLSHHCDNYPIVYLDIKFSVLQALVDFCYRGEVKLPQNELSAFIKAANTLRIKGLCNTELNDDGNSNGKKRRESRSNTPAPKRHRNNHKIENESEVSESAKVPNVTLVEGCANSNSSVESVNGEGNYTKKQEKVHEEPPEGKIFLLNFYVYFIVF
ncbi:hypothetical protein AAG570_013845 [Ranatra chinensis]|uniref:BTB domain-containing protein n=1 Tax=Ranatra chinensis TaxID=642074 RepID=A0ABD0YDC8_9HEMI